MVQDRRIGMVVLAAAWSSLGLAGCSENGRQTTHVQHVEGVAKSVDVNKKLVSMSIRNDRGEERIVEGTISDTTEVIINGRHHKIEDVMPGDQVVAHYSKREGEADANRILVSKVVVTRPEDRDWKMTDAGHNASEPAKPAQPTAPAHTPVASTSPQPAAPTSHAITPPPTAQPTRTAQMPPPAPTAPQPPKPMEPIKISQVPPQPAPPAPDQKVNLESWIFGMLRFNMEVALETRAQLLQTGASAADPRLAKQETVIRRARDLLIEHGEIVEDVNPPLPPQANAAGQD